MKTETRRRAGMALLVILVAAAWWYFWSCADRRPPRDVARSIEDGRLVNMLVLTTNAEEGLDAAVLVSYEPLSGQLVIFSVPPAICLDGVLEDSRSAPSDGTRSPDRLPVTLESAFAREDPRDLSRRLLAFFGPELSFVSVIPSAQVLRMVDLMGGIYVNVPARISFRSSTMRPLSSSPEWIEIPEGEDVFFDSDKSRMYLLYRFDGLGQRGQLFRARRFAAAFLRRARMHMEQDWFRGELVRLFPDVKSASVVRLFEAVSASPESSIDVRPLPGRSDLNAGVFWVSRNLLKRSLPQELKPLILSDLPRQRIVVQLLNGSGVTNVAAAIREKVSGYPDVDVVEMGNASRRDYEVTEIIDRTGHMRSAERIRDILGAGVLRRELEPKLLVDVTVIIGRDAAATVRPRF